MQSPARARYSPFASTAVSGVFCCAIAAPAPDSRTAASASENLLRVRGIITLPSTRLAAAFKRHRKASTRRKGRILRRRARGEQGGNRLHIVLGEKTRYDLHAIRRGRGARAVAPAAELAADVTRAQAKQAGDRRLHAA